MRKILLTVTAVGALAVPVGLASAQTDDTTDPDPPTTVVCDQDQTRLRLHSEECEGCGDQQREQYRAETGDRDMVRLREHDQDCDTCTGDQIQERERDHQQDRLNDGSGYQVRSGR